MWIDDGLEIRVLETQANRQLPLIKDEWVKSSHATINEIFAYQLGKAMQLPLPRTRCFLATKPIEIDDFVRPISSPVLLIENVEPLQRCGSLLNAPIDLRLKVRLLSFCAFDRGHEWPEIYLGNSSPYFLDLEGQFPIRRENMPDEHSLQCYLEQSSSAVDSCFDCADQIGIVDDLRIAMNRMIQMLEKNFRFDAPAALSREEDFTMRAVRIRIETIKDRL